jgi:signal peptidase I
MTFSRGVNHREELPVAGLQTLLSGPIGAYLEKIAGIAGLLVIAYLIITSVVGLFRRPAPVVEAPPAPGGEAGEEAAPVQPEVRSGGKSAVLEIIETIVMTVLIFAAVRLLVQNFRIEGSSMEPNLHDSEYLIIEKLSYRFGMPQRGDVIVFHYPLNPQRDFIKRIIGLPGESVQIRRSQTLINGQPIPELYGPAEATYNWGPETVPPNQYFVLGDNRNNSSDSHSWGMLPRELIIGRAWLIYWPLSEWGLIPHFPPAQVTSLAPQTGVMPVVEGPVARRTS